MDTIQNLLPQAMRTLETPIVTRLPATDFSRYFESFHLVGNETPEERETLSKMLSAANQWCSDFAAGNEPRWLSLVGTSGAGKTLLAECIWRFLRDHAESVYNRTVRDLLDNKHENVSLLYCYNQEGAGLVRFRPMMKRLREQDYTQLHRTCNDFVKIVDDYGSDMMKAEKPGELPRPTAYCVGVCGDIADARTRKWTVLTSNFARKDIAELFDARIASRMMRDGSVIVDCNIRDYGLRKEALLKGRA